jgi:hypothetical protein
MATFSICRVPQVALCTIRVGKPTNAECSRGAVLRVHGQMPGTAQSTAISMPIGSPRSGGRNHVQRELSNANTAVSTQLPRTPVPQGTEDKATDN